MRSVPAPSAAATGTGTGPVTDDYLAVLARLRPTVTSEVLDEFGHDITSLSRM
jgi:hypothetical protein